MTLRSPVRLSDFLCLTTKPIQLNDHKEEGEGEGEEEGDEEGIKRQKAS